MASLTLMVAGVTHHSLTIVLEFGYNGAPNSAPGVKDACWSNVEMTGIHHVVYM